MLKNTNTNIFIAEQVLPVILKYIILFGILLILTGLIMALFRVITKAFNRNQTALYLLCTVGPGLLICILGFIFAYIFHCELDIKSYIHAIPIGFVTTLLNIWICSIITKKKTTN